MVFRAEIEKAYTDQQLLLSKKSASTTREYGHNFEPTGNFIEVISGVRRSGKSTLLGQIMKQHDSNFAYFNFEDSRVFNFELSDFQKLDDVIGRGKSAYFFDEIQNVPSWELFVRQLHDRGEKVYVTGSNASLLSRELGTRLTGRHLRHELFPFSYPEFLVHKKLNDSLKAMELYIEIGGFPDYIGKPLIEILQNLLKDIVWRDLAVRYGVRNSNMLMNIALYLLSNIGKECSFNAIRKTFSIGSVNSVADYLSWLEDAYLLFFVPRFSYSAKVMAINPRKVYAVDTGMVTANSLSFSKDKGRLLENTVFLHLRRTHEKIFYYRENGECDFVVFQQDKCKLILQVCEEVHDENVERETKGLLEAMNYFKQKTGLIVTKKQSETLVYGQRTIVLQPINEFLLEK